MAGGKTLKESAASNPTALGDPVSLKAEKSDTSPTEQDRPNKSPEAKIEQDKPNQSAQNPALQGGVNGVKQLAPTEQDINQSTQNPTLQPSGKHSASLKELAQKDLGQAEKGNRSMIGDPVSLKAETSDTDPVKDGAEEEDGTGRGGKTGKGRDSKL
ncbi:hypothetical protein A1O7_02369 [Cladophialophora yegresii CBS 114405]|uniref:Uncharacterized protein n=1 Tax=Cladophialophora yegresii CBS 114405 TaxID=1182544 RepID=W9W1W9_9EURO|nr:uncharacterized protein A1O7_02369 [Cladophialophora yegresii CBS 114405]EXJ61938.1 hypothetical protein A1O7_02369 [Cladophialophora yegresii CBS 114405]